MEIDKNRICPFETGTKVGAKDCQQCRYFKGDNKDGNTVECGHPFESFVQEIDGYVKKHGYPKNTLELIRFSIYILSWYIER